MAAQPVTAPDWSAMLAAEEARAMAGKPAFRVKMACVAGIACPRCGAVMGARCKNPSPTKADIKSGRASPSCRERVWAMRALQRSPAMSRPPRVADVAGFLDTIIGFTTPLVGGTLSRDASSGRWYAVDGAGALAEWDGIADIDLDAAIRHGLVRLSVAASGAPVWVITEAGAEYAAGWKR